MNAISEMLLRSSASRYVSESERFILRALGLERAEAIRAACRGRITCTAMPDGHEVYSLDGKPFLRMGPLTTEARKVTDPPQIAFTCCRTMERIQ